MGWTWPKEQKGSGGGSKENEDSNSNLVYNNLWLTTSIYSTPHTYTDSLCSTAYNGDIIIALDLPISLFSDHLLVELKQSQAQRLGLISSGIGTSLQVWITEPLDK